MSAIFISLFSGAFQGTAFCSGWGEPEFVDLGWGLRFRNPKVIMDAYGNAFCAFDCYMDGHVYVNRYDGSSWSGPGCLNPGDEEFCQEQEMDVWDMDCNPQGDAIFVCNYRVDGVCALYARHYIAGTWGDPVLIFATGEYWLEVYQPGVAYSPDGTALCAFIVNENGRYHLYAAAFDGSSWSTPVPIATAGGESYHPRVAIDETGNGLCVFYHVVDGAFNICASHYSEGEWNEASAIGPAGSLEGEQPDSPPELAFDGGGNALCVFNVPGSPVEDPCAVYANKFIAGNWEGAVRIDGGPDGRTWVRPDLAVSGDGDAICAFTRDHSVWTERRAYVNVYTSGSAWSGPEDIGEPFGFSTCVGLDGLGGAISVFIGGRHMGCGKSRDVEHTCANYHSAGGWTGWEYFGGRGDLTACFDCGNPDLAVDHCGNAVCAYELTLPPGIESRIYAVSYTSDVPTPTPTPTATWDGVHRVSFQPSVATPPPLFMLDDGSAFTPHGMFQYGWI